MKHCLSCSTYYFLSSEKSHNWTPAKQIWKLRNWSCYLKSLNRRSGNRLPSSGLKTKISSSAWLHTLARATWNSTCRRASKLKQRVIHVKSKLKGPFTRVRTKTCTVPPCVYMGSAELDEFLNGYVCKLETWKKACQLFDRHGSIFVRTRATFCSDSAVMAWNQMLRLV